MRKLLLEFFPNLSKLPGKVATIRLKKDDFILIFVIFVVIIIFISLFRLSYHPKNVILGAGGLIQGRTIFVFGTPDFYDPGGYYPGCIGGKMPELSLGNFLINLCIYAPPAFVVFLLARKYLPKKNRNKTVPTKFPIALAIAAIYLILLGGLGIWRVLNIWEYSRSDTFQLLLVYLREASLFVLSIIAGIGLFFSKKWARQIALWIIPMIAFFQLFGVAFVITKGYPTSNNLLLSTFIVLGWNGLWFYLIFRRSSKTYLAQKNNTASPDL